MSINSNSQKESRYIFSFFPNCEIFLLKYLFILVYMLKITWVTGREHSLLSKHTQKKAKRCHTSSTFIVIRCILCFLWKEKHCEEVNRSQTGGVISWKRCLQSKLTTPRDPFRPESHVTEPFLRLFARMALSLRESCLHFRGTLRALFTALYKSSYNRTSIVSSRAAANEFISWLVSNFMLSSWPFSEPLDVARD